jgi:hypothetical protein
MDVKIIKNALNEFAFQDVLSQYDNANWPETNHTIWKDSTLYDRGDNCNVDITPIEPIQSVVDEVLKHTWEPTNPDHFSTQLFYNYHNYSYINWHVDSGKDRGYNGAYTLYLNEVWESNWGGQLLFGNNNFIPPERNMLIMMPPNVPHSVAMVHKGASPRKVLQGFILNEPRSEYER